MLKNQNFKRFFVRSGGFARRTPEGKTFQISNFVVFIKEVIRCDTERHRDLCKLVFIHGNERHSIWVPLEQAFSQAKLAEFSRRIWSWNVVDVYEGKYLRMVMQIFTWAMEKNPDMKLEDFEGDLCD